ncbi:MAG: hydrogenase 3 maturation endopeptidase HyCI [Candidatus Saganbacteria bacterium]|nr:hydrogenase 3 maturation endopeptidase HyCI [Candidatus Saganbacteria bacterium]
MGNTLRHDDGVAPLIAERISKSKIQNPKIKVLNVGEKPENAIDEAVRIKPAKTIIIDAADFGGVVGEARIIDRKNIPETTMSTHTFPLPIIAKMIEDDAKSPVYFIGIQPGNLQLGEGLSPEVLNTAKEIIKLCTSSTC